MTEESEESCLVNSKLMPLGNYPVMSYTEGIIAASSASLENTASHQPHQSATEACNSGTSAGHPIQSGRASQQSQITETGELIELNNELMLSQFHFDAIKQAGCGRFQLIASLICGLSLSGHAVQVFSLFYIMPSAEIEYCIADNEKSWVGNITLVGLSVGSLLWGGLASCSGRRKTLLSCLGVSAVFSVIAAFMPTYGPFMMARFTAAVGFGGVLPASASYLGEVTTQTYRPRMLGLLCACGLAGGLVAGGIAMLIVPTAGQLVMLENKEHFSAWHRFLLLVTLPTIAAIFGFLWLPESPRFLLEFGREVESLSIYQRIFQTNRLRGGYAMTELEMPTGTRTQSANATASVLVEMANSFCRFSGSFAKLFHPRVQRSTVLLISAWTAAIFVHHGLTVFVIQHSKAMELNKFNSQTVTRTNLTFESANFNASIENIIFDECHFVNSTFRRAFLSHVEFKNCTFLDTEFANVKTSRTTFKNCYLDDVRFIDTDLSDRHFENCSMIDTKIVNLLGSCDRDFEFNIFVDSVWRSQLGSLLPSLVILIMVGEAMCRFEKNRVAANCFFVAMVLGVVLGFVHLDEHVIWIGGALQGFVIGGVTALIAITIETYGTALRCSALGICICGGHLGALFGAHLYAALPIQSTYAAAITTVTLAVPSIASLMLRDPCALL